MMDKCLLRYPSFWSVHRNSRLNWLFDFQFQWSSSQDVVLWNSLFLVCAALSLQLQWRSTCKSAWGRLWQSLISNSGWLRSAHLASRISSFSDPKLSGLALAVSQIAFRIIFGQILSVPGFPLITATQSRKVLLPGLIDYYGFSAVLVISVLIAFSYTYLFRILIFIISNYY